MTAQTSNNFADSKIARILALCLAGCFAFILFINYGAELTHAFSGKQSSAIPASGSPTSAEEATNPALAACLQKRIADVEKMKEEGILSDSQYASFRSRAEGLCHQQNPV